VEAQKEFENVAKVIEQLYRNAPAFICTLRGTDHIYELVNPAYQNMLGKNGLSGKKFFDANPELRDQSIYKLLEHVYKTGKPFVGTEEVVYISREAGEKPQATY